jgi:hypothetical protein
MLTILYRAPANVSDSDVTIFKALSATSNVLFIICWLIASGFNKASITDMDLDPEDMEADIFDDVSTNETQ